MSNGVKDFDSNFLSIDDITYDIDDDVIDSILEENVLGTDEFDQTIGRFDDAFLGSLKDCNYQDCSGDNTENLYYDLLFEEKNNVVRNNVEVLESVNGCFDATDAEPLPFASSITLTKEQQMEKINQYSKSLQSTFQQLKRPEKKITEPIYSIPVSSDYRDLSMMKDEQVSLKFKSMVGRSQETFPVKLHRIIDVVEQDGLSSIISWCSHGRAFKIHSNTRFINEVMTKYFYQTKMSSFTRQLGT